MGFIVEASLVFLTFLLFYITKFLRRKLNRSLSKQDPKRLPPGPVPWPVVGCVPQMLRHKPAFRWIHGVMKEMGTDIACFRLGKVHLIPVTCPKIAREFLKERDAVFADRALTPVTHILTSGHKTVAFAPYGETWKKMRKVLTSEIVSPARHRWLHDKRVEEANNLVRYIYNQSKENGRVNVRTACRHYTGNVIRRMMFNRRYFVEKMNDDGAPTLMEEEHVDALFTTLKYTHAFSVSDYLPYLEGLDLDGHQKIAIEAKKTILKYHDPIIKERVQKWRTNDGHNFREENELNGIVPQDLLDVLVSLKSSDGKPLLTVEDITAQTWEIMIATVDNPSNAVEWVVAEMLSNPEILDKAVEELDRVVGKDRLVQEQDIPNLNYIKACAREAFRLHPFAPFNVPHVSLSDTVVAGYHIPEGSRVVLSRMGLGRNPKVWDEPLKFKPERHLLNSGGHGNEQQQGSTEAVMLTEHDLRFISFSTGRRGCVAATLGTAMTVMLLARMIQGFSWTKPPELSDVSLKEAEDELCLADPLIARAEPRLPLHLYP